MSQIKYFANSFAWGAISKIFDAIVKFLTIPLLLNYFGKDNYGILTLAIATNAYLGLLDMGMNIGAIKYFSQWIEEKKIQIIDKVARTSISIYLVIGIINAILLVIVAIWGESLFTVTREQFNILKSLFFILSVYTVINWSTYVFNQLMIANEKISYIQKLNIVKSILQLILVYISISFGFSLTDYFLFFLLINSFVIIPYYLNVKKYGLIRSLKPTFCWNEFKPVFFYSMAIFSMGLFQYTATQSRPIILGIFNTGGIDILSEYRIIEVFPFFVISIGGMITTILLPKTSNIIKSGDNTKIKDMAYKGTSITTIVVCLLSFPIIIVSKEIIEIYVGKGYIYLSEWLSLWVFSLVLFLYNSPVASLVLATGKTRMLIYSTAIACIISVVLNATLCPAYGVGSAVIGYLVYVIIQMSFYYFYFNNRILRLNSFKIFKAFIKPFLIASIIALPIYIFELHLESIILRIFLKAFSWFLLFVMGIYIFNISEVRNTIKKKLKIN